MKSIADGPTLFDVASLNPGILESRCPARCRVALTGVSKRTRLRNRATVNSIGITTPEILSGDKWNESKGREDGVE